MIVYEVRKPIKNTAIGLERQPGQTINDAELRSALTWRDALLKVGAIAPVTAAQPAEPKDSKKAVRNAVS